MPPATVLVMLAYGGNEFILKMLYPDLEYGVLE
jgi:hypothetical protein